MKNFLQKDLYEIGKKAKKASKKLACIENSEKVKALNLIEETLKFSQKEIFLANEKDLEAAKQRKLSDAMIDRLLLNEERFKALLESVHDIAELKDPVGDVIKSWDQPNGLHFKQVRTPIGVIAIIYESRPNVTVDAAALCIKSGNAAILRGGSDSFFTSLEIYKVITKALEKSFFPKDAVQFIPTTDREVVGHLLKGLDHTIDVIIPRGGKNLVDLVQREARIPVFSHLEGICHLYIDKDAILEKAKNISLNAKMRRPGICGATETLLLDKSCKRFFIVEILDHLYNSGCELRVESEIFDFYKKAKLAKEEDFGREFLDKILAVKFVEGVHGAIEHIARYSSHHTEAIVTENKKTVDKFFKSLDSAILLHNASTQFADGGEFGFGAEMGIATGKMHARGPIGVEQLTSFHYLVYGDGQIRA